MQQENIPEQAYEKLFHKTSLSEGPSTELDPAQFNFLHLWNFTAGPKRFSNGIKAKLGGFETINS